MIRGLSYAKALDSSRLGGQLPAYFAAATHNHDAAYLGIGAQAADAAKLGGQLPSYYAAANHDHAGVYLPIGGKAADADLLDGLDSTAFALTGHNHTGVYEPVITAGPNSAYYWKGNKTWGVLNQAAVAGLTASDSPTFAGITSGNLNLVSNTLSSINTNGDILLAPNGTGAVKLGNMKFTGTQFVMTSGDMTLISAASSNFTMRAGANFAVTDLGQNWRFSVAAAYPGDVTIATGSLKFGSTVRITNAGAATLTTVTASGAVRSDVALQWGDPTVDGNWQMVVSGADLLIQKRVGGAWVTKSTIAGA